MDPLNTEFDQYTGQWAVYATRDLYRDGKVLAAKGDKLAGNGFDGSKLGGELFTATADGTDRSPSRRPRRTPRVRGQRA